jgi:hypothetical protein
MSEFFNNLSPAELERLAIASEEMGEAQQIIGKILRHGYESYNPNDPSAETNRALLETELGHVMFGIKQLIDARDIIEGHVWDSTDEKAQSVKPYLHHN